jgi:hypothetical protein
MPPAKKDPEKPEEIEDVEQWNAIVSKDNVDLNVIDVYAEWCGPCMCESAPRQENIDSSVHSTQRWLFSRAGGLASSHTHSRALRWD